MVILLPAVWFAYTVGPCHFATVALLPQLPVNIITCHPAAQQPPRWNITWWEHTGLPPPHCPSAAVLATPLRSPYRLSDCFLPRAPAWPDSSSPATHQWFDGFTATHALRSAPPRVVCAACACAARADAHAAAAVQLTLLYFAQRAAVRLLPLFPVSWLS